MTERAAELDEGIEQLARLIEEAESVVALTGAGVSTDSGIPDFRSPASGLWEEHDPMVIASISGFRRHPRAFYEFWGERFSRLSDARPNVTHDTLAQLERQGLLSAVVTQNIDGLHRDAGSDRVLEVHGSYRQTRCLGCGRTGALGQVLERMQGGRLPFCERCGELVKPDVVLFGEDLPPVFAEAEALVRRARLLLVLGSSLRVHPVAGLVPLAKSSGAAVVLINRDPSPYDAIAQMVLHTDLAPAMRRLGARLAARSA